MDEEIKKEYDAQHGAGSYQDDMSSLRFLAEAGNTAMQMHLRLAFLAPIGAYYIWLNRRHHEKTEEIFTEKYFSPDDVEAINAALKDEDNIVTKQLAWVAENHLMIPCNHTTLNEDDEEEGETLEGLIERYVKETRQEVRKVAKQLVRLVMYRESDLGFSDFSDSKMFVVNYAAATVRASIQW